MNGGFVTEFLFGDTRVATESERATVRMHLDERTEGWVGIPHGGIGMGSIMELASFLEAGPRDTNARYPMSAEFRMGGASVRTGDTVTVSVVSSDGGFTGSIVPDGQDRPYIEGTVRYGADERNRRDDFISFLPASYSEIHESLARLPHYRNCFVCGVERTSPGLNRVFNYLNDSRINKTVVSHVGMDDADDATVHRFSTGSMLHPIAPLALLDEVMGWGGFLVSGQGGVSVRLGYTFYRGIRIGERVVLFGRGTRVKGSVSSRMLFWADGGAAVIGSDGTLEPVIVSSGQWFAVSELTEQMKIQLMPQDLIDRAFALAGS